MLEAGWRICSKMFIFACFKTSYFYFQRTVPDWGCYNNEVATSKGTMVNKSRASFWRKNMLKFGYVGLVAKSCPTLATPWTVACQALLSMGLCRQEYWSGLPFPSPGDLPDPGIKPGSPALQADSFMTLETENTLSYSDRVLDFISYSDLN